MATIKDIARIMNLGVSTVSMALNDNPKISKETRFRVQQTARELNYRKNTVALSLKNQKTQTIGLIIEDASRDFFSRFLKDFYAALEPYGYHVIIVTCYGGKTDSAERFLADRLTEGCVVFTNSISDEVILQAATEHFPIVCINRRLKNDYITSVYLDEISGTSKILNYLEGLGMRNLLFVEGKVSGKSIGAKRRRMAFEKLTEAAGLHASVRRAAGNDIEAGKRFLLETEDPTVFDAVIFSNDELAIGALTGCVDRGIEVPKDLAVVGYNDIQLSRFVRPSLTTMDGGGTLLAQESVKMMMHFLESGEKEIGMVEVPTELLIRESTE